MSNSRTHYIPVSGITIEDITNVINDTLPGIIADILPPLLDDAVGDMLNPDPAVYCPINGYNPEPKPEQVPDDPVVPVGEGEYVFLVDNSLGASVAFYATPAYTIELTEMDGTIIQTFNRASGYSQIFELPFGGYKQYFVRMRGTSAEITYIRRGTSPVPVLQPILYAWLNCKSNLISLQSFMDGVVAFKGLTIQGDVSRVTSFDTAFRNSGIEEFDFPVNMPALRSTTRMFESSNIINFRMPGTNSPITNMTYMFYATGKLKKLEMNITVPLSAGSNFLDYMCSYSSLEELALNFSVGKAATINLGFAHLCNTCSKLKKAVLPYLTGECNNASIFENCSELASIEFRGLFVNFSSATTGAKNCFKLKELIFNTPSLLGSTLTIFHQSNSNNIIEKIIFPTDLCLGHFFASYFPFLKELKGTFSSTESTTIDYGYRYPLEVVDVPNLPASLLGLGSNTHRLSIKYVNIDWANSSFSITQNNVNIHCDIDATEINRIFGLLPAMTKTIDVRNSTGAAGCDPSIATAKGWTVLR